ncbi:MAG: hypothetical protein ABGX83_11150 [Nitrospira sp.]|nr:hypothetical protein [Candidatus Manganitrophaceae bacterium]HIL34621.1 hypothetical protein [Candidatus Manganitrophaceae bacterium]
MKNLHHVIAVLFVLGAFSLPGLSHAVDANFNSQLTNIRTAVPTTTGVENPTLGFDPCKDGNNVAGICDLTSGALLSTDNVGISGGPPGIFSLLGPGAITDNMFGIVSGNALGSDGTSGGTGNAADITTTRCAPGTGTSGFFAPLTGTVAVLDGLNCGSIRINATQQGQIFPSGTNSLGVAGNGSIGKVNSNMSFIADSCAVVCPGDGHLGLDLTNNFTFMINSSAGVILPTEATTTSFQKVRQVTGVNPAAGIGTLTGPGGGDQVFELTTSFTVRSPDTGDGDPLDPLVVTWSQLISDPDQSGTSGAKFEQSLSGTFTRDEKFSGLSQVFDCPTGSTTTTINICTQYPNGLSQTTGDIAGATLP